MGLEPAGADDAFHSMLRGRGLWPPPPEMNRINQKSANMATKLWIDQQPGDPLNDLDYLVAGGQSTFCYNFMRYLWLQRRRADGSFDDAGIEAVFELALDQWARLHRDPLCLLRERKEHSRLPELRRAAAEDDAGQIPVLLSHEDAVGLVHFHPAVDDQRRHAVQQHDLLLVPTPIRYQPHARRSDAIRLSHAAPAAAGTRGVI